MRQYRKAGLCIMGLLMLLGGAHTAYAQAATTEAEAIAEETTETEDEIENAQFQVSAQLGLQDMAIFGLRVPVRITVTSDVDFTGEIRVVPVRNGYPVSAARSQDVEMTAGRSQTVSFSVMLNGDGGECYVQILDADGEVVYSKRNEVRMYDFAMNCMVGVLSDGTETATYMNGLSVSLGGSAAVARTLLLDETELPDEEESLAMLEYLIIDDFDSAKLSDAQYTAITDWVRAGGVLILSAGDNYDRVAERFADDFCPMTFGKTEEKTVVFSEQDQEVSVERVPAVAASFEEEGGTDSISSGNTAFCREVGNGKVVLLTYALGDEPICSDNARTWIATHILETTASERVTSAVGGEYYDDSGSYYTLFQIANLSDETDKPGVWLYAIILCTYVVVVGPLLYLLLKRLHMREKIWIAIPVVALLGTALVYATGGLYRMDEPMLNTISMISLDGDRETEKVYTNMICPKARTETIRLQDDYKEVLVTNDWYSSTPFGDMSREDDYEYLIHDRADGRELTFYNRHTFQTQVFTAVRSGENTSGKLVCDLDCTTTGFSGTVSNETQYDLTGVVVTFENHIWVGGDLKAGQTVTVDPDELITSVGYDSFGRIYTTSEISETKTQLYQIDSLMENYYMHISDYGKGLIWAKIKGYRADFVAEGDVTESGIGVIYMNYEADYSDVDGVYYQSLQPMVTKAEGNYDGNTGMIYDSDVDITYSFADYSGITELKLKSKDADWTDADMKNVHYASVYAYNPDSGVYDEIFADSDTLSGDALAQYVKNGYLQLRYESGDEEADSYYIPKICAKGDD